jgi:segregation and condensation protein A
VFIVRACMNPNDLAVAPNTVEQIGVFRGEAIVEMPTNLYIPPEALQIMLESFEGPLDLLLFLIRKENLDVLDIPMAELTAQYMAYVESMKANNLELAAEYLLMAAVLTEIKSRMLLPRPGSQDDDEDLDPRAELVRRLIEYEQMKKASERLTEHAVIDRDFTKARAFFENTSVASPPNVTADDLRMAWIAIFNRAKQNRRHIISREELSVREHMSQILRKLQGEKFVRFDDLFEVEKGVQFIVVSFLAVLELAKDMSVELSQQGVFSPIYVRLSDGI